MNVTACRAFIENVCLYHRMGRLKKMSRKDQKIYCNCCGKVICMLSEKDHTSFLTVEKEWGYFSDKKDGYTEWISVSPVMKKWWENL